VFALGQRLRRFADHVTHTAGAANGERVRRWFQAKKAGWYAVLEDPQMPVTSTLLDQAHNAIDRKLFMMKGFHHPKESQQAFLTGLAHLYNPTATFVEHALLTQGFMGTSTVSFPHHWRPQHHDSTWPNLVDTLK